MNAHKKHSSLRRGRDYAMIYLRGEIKWADRITIENKKLNWDGCSVDMDSVKLRA